MRMTRLFQKLQEYLIKWDKDLVMVFLTNFLIKIPSWLQMILLINNSNHHLDLKNKIYNKKIVLRMDNLLGILQ
jgi:hypothetical protein